MPGPRAERGSVSTPRLLVSPDIPELLDRLCYRFPSLLIDGVIEHDPGARIVAVKNVTVGEEFFQGHFPGNPMMPGVMMIEALAQAASVLLLDEDVQPSAMRTVLRGVNGARFRRQVVPGDRLLLEVTIGRRRRRLAVAAAKAVAAVVE